MTAVEVVSDAGGDDTYGLDETVRVRLTFGEAVSVDTFGGAPRLKLDMDPAHWGEKWAAYLRCVLFLCHDARSTPHPPASAH